MASQSFTSLQCLQAALFGKAIPTSRLALHWCVHIRVEMLYRSGCHDGRLYAAPKFYRHTASVSRGQINLIDPLAGTTNGYVFNTNDDVIYMQMP